MKLIFNPFERLREKQLLASGTAFTIIASALAFFFKARFDGILDMHFVEQISWYQPAIDNIINIAAGTLFFFLAGFAINRKTRMIDILAAVMVARAPLYILVFFNAGNFMSDTTTGILNSLQDDPKVVAGNLNVALLAVFGIISIIFMIWFVTLLYNGYRVASNAKGPVAIVLFILAIIISEVFSKWAIISIS